MRIALFDDEIEIAAAVRSADRPTCGRRSPRFTVYPVVALRDAARRRCCARSRRSRSSCASGWSSSSADDKLVEAQRLEQRTRFDLEMMTEIGYCKGIENYSRYLSGRNAGRAAADADRLPAAATR